MNFAKKTFAAVMSVAMLASSLATGTTALAAEKKQFTAMGATQAISATVKEKQDEEGWTSYEVKSNSYYTFTPATSSYYKVDLAATPIYRTEVKKTDSYGNTWTESKYSYTATAGAERVDEASVSIYEKYNATTDELTDYVGSVSTDDFKYATGYTQKEAGAYPKAVDYVQYVATSSVKLTAGKTYYISAYNDYWSNSIENSKGKREYLTGAQLSITPTDWSFYKDSKEVSTQQFEVKGGYWNDDDEWVEDGTYKTTRTVYTPVMSAKYVGSAKDVVVPADINGIPVESVTGTTNKSITSLTLSSSVKSISGLSNLKSLCAVNLASVEKMEEDCFYGDSALTAVSIPATLKTIPASAFEGCSALSSVTIANGVKNIGYDAFYNTALKSVVIPASVISIGSYAFGYENGFNVNTVDPYDTESVLANGFVMATTGSAEAFDYAQINGIPCYDITNGCPHPYVTTTVAATLFAKGSTTSVCPICGATTTKSIKKKTFKLSSVKAAKKALTVKAAKQEGITGYQVQYSTSSKFTKKTTKTITVKTTKALNKKITGLKSGKKYYVKARAYTTVNGKTVYSAYTSAKSVKVK